MLGLRSIFKRFGKLSHLEINVAIAFIVGCISGLATAVISKIKIVWIDSLEPEFIVSSITIIILLLILAGLKRYS